MTASFTPDSQRRFPDYSWQPESGPADNSYAAQLADVDGLKTFPVVASQALNILSNPEFRVAEVTDVIKQDHLQPFRSVTAGSRPTANMAGMKLATVANTGARTRHQKNHR